MHALQSAVTLSYKEGQVLQVASVQLVPLRHVHTQLPATPDTLRAPTPQSCCKVQMRLQFGQPVYPATQALQPVDAFWNCELQVQEHPVFVLPETAVAWLLQFFAMVQVR